MFRSRQGGQRGQPRPFFGPLLPYDFVRSSRSGQLIGHRCLYAGLLLFLLLMFYWSYFPRSWYLSWDALRELVTHGFRLSVQEKAALASGFFAQFMMAQFLVVVLITPLYAAGAIAEEKERRTLEFLFATDLSNREIVLGLLGARLGKLSLLLLTGLPFLSVMQFLGGVDPNFVLGGFLATTTLMLSLGSISMLCSVQARTSLGAIMGAYGVTVPLAMVTVLPLWAIAFEILEAPGAAGLGSAYSLSFLLLFCFFCVLHGFTAWGCCRGAIAQVRREGLRQANEPKHLAKSGYFLVPVLTFDAIDAADAAAIRGSWGLSRDR